MLETLLVLALFAIYLFDHARIAHGQVGETTDLIQYVNERDLTS